MQSEGAIEQYPDEILELFAGEVLAFAQEVTEADKSSEALDWDTYLAQLASDETSFPSGPSDSSSSTGRKHCRDSDIDTGSYRGQSDVKVEEDDDDEQIKSRRLGSLGRIIANTAMVVERTESNSTLPPNVDKVALSKIRKAILSEFFAAFNLGNMTGLATLIQEHCSETCELVTPDLIEPIHGRAAIMMLFSLYFENFPDGIYREIPSPQDVPPELGSIVSAKYTFTGTCVLGQSIQLLYDQVREHWQNVQASARIEEASLIENIVGKSWIPSSIPSSSSGQSLTNSTSAASVPPLMPPLGNLSFASNTSVLNGATTSSVGDTNASTHSSSEFPLSTAFASPLIHLPPSSSFQPLQSTLAAVSSGGALTSIKSPSPVGTTGAISGRIPSPPNTFWSLSPPTSSRKSLKGNEVSNAAANLGASPVSPRANAQVSTPALPPAPQFYKPPPASGANAKPAASHPPVTPWLMKTLQSLSSSFGKVAGRMAATLTLRERQTKHKRVMEFDFSDCVDENSNFISKIVISSVNKS